MSFKKAVQAEPPPVNGAYRTGKRALKKKHRRLVTCEDPQRLTGSIDLDSALARQPGHVSAARWDYGLGYRPPAGKPEQKREQAIWIEVHPATTSEVSAVLGKLQWLRDWLNAGAGRLKQMTDRAAPGIRFVWIAPAGDHIPRNSPQARRLSRSAIQGPRRKLSLP